MRYHLFARSLPLFVLCLILAACAVPELPSLPAAEAPADSAAPPEPTATPVTLDSVYTLTETTISFNYPDGWALREQPRTATLAPSDAALDAATLSEGLVIQIDATPLEALVAQYADTDTSSVAELFELSRTGPEQAGYELTPPETLTIDGQAGLVADLEREGAAGRLVVIGTEDQMVRILGQAAASGWQQQESIFDDVVASIQFDAEVTDAAAEESADPNATPAAETTGSESEDAAATDPTVDASNTVTDTTGTANTSAASDGSDASAASTGPAAPAQPILVTEGGPPEFVLRLGSNEGTPEQRFAAARGLATASDGTLYLAESSQGIWVFDADGTLQTTFGGDDLLDAYDVTLGPEGDIFVADYGQNSIVRFRPDGTQLQSWGQTGEQPDQFGLLSPQRIAAGPDGSIYALDSRIVAGSSSAVSSVMRFSDEGVFIERLDLPPASAPNDLAVDRAGNIYLADSSNGTVIKVSPVGDVIAQFSNPTNPGSLTAGAVDLDASGNLYVATWGQGVLKFAPDGTLIVAAGGPAEPGTIPQPGQFSLPNGIASAPDNLVWISDNDGEYSAVTALQLIDPTAAAESTDEGIEAAPDETPTETADGLAPETPDATPVPEEELFGQWASDATASAQYDDTYSADGMTGEPDVDICRSSEDAWAAPEPDGVETLELEFDEPVYATQVNIYQNHQPGSVIEVTLIDEEGDTISVYEGEAELLNTCPFVLTVDFRPTLKRIVALELIVDQSGTGAWNEIDAVELVGFE